MARRFKWTAREINKQRAENYAWCFDMMKMYQSLSLPEQEFYRKIARNVRMPALTVFGSLDYSDDELSAIFAVGRANRIVEPILLCPLWTGAGWEEFQRLWKDLPEPVDFVHMVGLPVYNFDFAS